MSPATAAPDHTAPGDNDAIGALIALTEDLHALVAEETRLLEAGRPAALADLHPKKTRLLAQYQNLTAAIAASETALGDDNSERRAHLRRITQAFRETVKTHGRMIISKKAVIDGVINAVKDTATRQQRPLNAYNREAGVAARTMTKAVPLALNRTV